MVNSGIRGDLCREMSFIKGGFEKGHGSFSSKRKSSKGGFVLTGEGQPHRKGARFVRGSQIVWGEDRATEIRTKRMH